MEHLVEMDTDTALRELDRRVTTLEAEHKERWKSQFLLNKEVKKALADLVESVVSNRLKLAFLWGLSGAVGAALGGYLS